MGFLRGGYETGKENLYSNIFRWEYRRLFVGDQFCAGQLKVTIDTAIQQFAKMSSLQQEVDKLRETVDSREKIDRAKGALMQRGMSEPDTYRKMQKPAMDKLERGDRCHPAAGGLRPCFKAHFVAGCRLK